MFTDALALVRLLVGWEAMFEPNPLNLLLEAKRA
jgi:hypothetical protein